MGRWQLWSRRRRREDADRDGRWEALAHTLARVGFWSGLPSAQTQAQQRLAYGETVAVGPPKTAASRRTIAVDRQTVRLLRAYANASRQNR